MGIPVKCPNPACGKEFSLKAEFAGKKVRCSSCKQTFDVPTIPGVQQSQALSIVQPGTPSGHSERSGESRRTTNETKAGGP